LTPPTASMLLALAVGTGLSAFHMQNPRVHSFLAAYNPLQPRLPRMMLNRVLLPSQSPSRPRRLPPRILPRISNLHWNISGGCHDVYTAILATLHTCHWSAKQVHCEAVIPVYSASLSKAHSVNASTEISSYGVSESPANVLPALLQDSLLRTSPSASTSAVPSAGHAFQRRPSLPSSINGHLLPPTPPAKGHPLTSPNRGIPSLSIAQIDL
jgi:hypothetical protein